VTCGFLQECLNYRNTSDESNQARKRDIRTDDTQKALPILKDWRAGAPSQAPAHFEPILPRWLP
jgi:SOS-response transcriptional repressor LexA